MKAKIIFVLGGVFSGIGKGIISSTIGKLFKQNGLKVSMQKHDPYLNVDCGLLSPIEHGEVFVTHDGLETDLDLGNYERFLHQKMSVFSSITAGQIYQKLLQKERNREYQGKTINIYDVANKIKQEIFDLVEHENSDCIVVELGGTLGDNDLKPFLIAAAQLQKSLPQNDVAFILLVYVHYLEYLQQFKTKPAQNAVAQLRNNAIEPDIIIIRSSTHLDFQTKTKFAQICYLPTERIFNVPQENIYLIPTLLLKNGLFNSLLDRLKLPNQLDTAPLQAFAKKIARLKVVTKKIKIYVVNKYLNFHQSYLSLYQAIYAASISLGINFEIVEIDPDRITIDNVRLLFEGCNGILVPGGFGSRGVEGKMLAIQFARQKKIPFLGICLGFQVALIEFARNVLGLTDANSEEFITDLSKKQQPVIHYFDKKQQTIIIGARKVTFSPETLTSQMLSKKFSYERFRNRLVFNNRFFLRFLRKGMVFSAFLMYQKQQSVVAFELPNHPFFVGVQFHLELNSLPEKPHPILVKFFENCYLYQQKE